MSREDVKVPSEVKVKIRPIAYVWGIIAVGVMTAISAFLLPFNVGAYPNPWGWMGWWSQIYPLAWLSVLWMVLLGLIVSILPKRLTPTAQEMTLILSMVYITQLIPTGVQLFHGFACVTGVRLLGEPMRTASETLFTTHPYASIWGPNWSDSQAWSGVFTGGAAVPWGAWSGYIAFMTVFFVAQYFLYICAASLFRRIWIDIENLPFPMATAMQKIVSVSTQKEKKGQMFGMFNLSWFWLGTLIGILGSAGLWLNFAAPGIFTSPTTGAVGFLEFDLYNTPLREMLPNTAIDFTFDAWLIGMAILIPAEVQITYVVWTVIIWWILPLILTSAGFFSRMYMNAYDTHIVTWRTGDMFPMWWREAAAGGAGTIWIGAAWGMLIIPIIQYRRSFIEGLKAIAKPNPTIDANEPIPYRWMWIGAIGLWLVWCGLLVIVSGNLLGGINVIGLLFSTELTYIVVQLWVARIGAVTGPVSPMTNSSGHQIEQVYSAGWVINYNTTPWPVQPRMEIDTTPIHMATMATGPHGWYQGVLGASEQSPAKQLLESYKLGSLTGTSNRAIFKGALLAIPFTIVLYYILTLIFAYQLGLQSKWAGSAFMGAPPHGGLFFIFGSSAAWYNCCVGPGGLTWVPDMRIYIFNLIGILFVALLYFLRARFPILPINPFGVLAAGWLVPQFLMPVIIGYIIKRLAMRAGGIAFYEGKIVPLAMGFLFSINILVLILSGANAARVL